MFNIESAFKVGAALTVTAAAARATWKGRNVISLEEANRRKDQHWEETLNTKFGKPIQKDES